MHIALSAAIAITLTGRPDAPRFEELATAAVADLQATVTVIKADQAELRKISKDFGMAYRLKSVTMRFKRPGKLRMDGKIGQESALYIVNGSTRFYSVPRLKLSKKDDLGAAAGKRYSLLEFGIASRGDLSAVDSKHLRTESLDGIDAHVFEVAYRGDDSLKYLLWIDPRTHVILRRDWLDSAGNLRASFIHKGAKEIAPGLWIPTRLEIRNADGIIAAESESSNIKVNQNIPESFFAIS